MKEPILEYLQFAEPETRNIDLDKLKNDAEMDIKKLSLDRKRTMNDWGSKVKDSKMDKVEKPSY